MLKLAEMSLLGIQVALKTLFEDVSSSEDPGNIISHSVASSYC